MEGIDSWESLVITERTGPSAPIDSTLDLEKPGNRSSFCCWEMETNLYGAAL